MRLDGLESFGSIPIVKPSTTTNFTRTVAGLRKEGGPDKQHHRSFRCL